MTHPCGCCCPDWQLSHMRRRIKGHPPSMSAWYASFSARNAASCAFCTLSEAVVCLHGGGRPDGPRTASGQPSPLHISPPCSKVQPAVQPSSLNMLACSLTAEHAPGWRHGASFRGGPGKPWQPADPRSHMSGWCCLAFWKKAFLMSALLQGMHRQGEHSVAGSRGPPLLAACRLQTEWRHLAAVHPPATHLAPGFKPSTV